MAHPKSQNEAKYRSTASARMKQFFGAKFSQILFALHALDRRKPQDRGRRFRIGSRHELPADGGDDY
jgi:hypothetical protein